ncbi:MAG TPA: amino acid adenylation domain-containing protein, partial [Thioploca sp.]|nr:amino acid adenylation domain-containing protein [Thioploca sp.]
IDLFEEQVEKTPHNVAVVFEDQQLTYQELNSRANQLAHHLQTLGVKPEVLVAICVDRSLDMVIGLLSILKAGGAYVPLDPNYPPERLAFMLADSQVQVLLTQQTFLEKHNSPIKDRIICLDTDWEMFSNARTSNPVSGAQPDNLAYVIYTSGSTGKPKGVVISHHSVVNFLSAMQDSPGLTEQDILLAVTTISFDIAVLELYLPLLVGAKVVLVSREIASDGLQLLKKLNNSGATVMQATPATWRMLLTAGETEHFSLKSFIGGEALPSQLAHQLQEKGAEVWNLYGPTETTVWSACYPVAKVPLTGLTCDTESIGSPIANTQIYILDQHHHPMPIGVPGELYIGGVGLARGYLNRPELTEEKFIPNPFINVELESENPKSARLYKTGDLARYLQDGKIEYLGRIDHQVKIRGFRIELGEIEAVLIQHPHVQETVVIIHEEVSVNKRLVAYFVSNLTPDLIPPYILRDFLKEKLPDYMLPSFFIELEALPLTPNGKVDRRALVQLSVNCSQLSEETFVAPRTPEEELLVGIWAEILGVKRVGIHDNFFELGGDSILSIQVVAKANQAGLQLTPRTIFQHQTIAELVTVAGTSSAYQAEQGLVTGQVPLTPIQHWFFKQNLPEPHHYNQSVLFEGPSDLNPALLEQAVQQLLRHHDALRLRFTTGKSGWQATQINPEEETLFQFIDLSTLPAHTQRYAVETAANQQQARLNFSEGPLLRVLLFSLGTEQPTRLLIIIHHLAIDGISWRILLEDLQTAYHHLKRGDVIQLPYKTTSFQAWSSQLTEYAQSPAIVAELEHWLSHIEMTLLPVDRSPSQNEKPFVANTVAATAHVKVSLTASQTQALLNEVPQAYHTQINDVLLTALVQSFAKWSGQQTLHLDLEGHGREIDFEGFDISRTVGWFTSIFPVWLDLGPATTPGEALKSIKEQLRSIPNHGVGYGLLRYLNPKTAARLKNIPQAEVCFNYLGQFDQQGAGDALFKITNEDSGQMHSPLENRRYLLEINGLITEGQLQLDWTYSENVHRRATIEQLAQYFIEALTNLIAHCQLPEAVGYTPSDFPLAGLNQDELDQLTTQQGKNIESIYPLSHTQAGILFHTLYAPKSGVYFEQLSCTLNGALNLTAFQQAWQHVVERHPVLRSFFIWENRHQPLQIVCRSVNLPWQQHDWRRMTSTAQQTQLETFLSSEREQGFALDQAPLMRCAFIQLGENTHQFVWSHHHLLMDGWCLPLILKEVFAYYEAQCQGIELHLEPLRPYQDYISWLQQQDKPQAEQFWHKKLQGFVAPTPLSVEETAGTKEKGSRQQEIKLPKQTTEALQTLAQYHHITLNTLIQGAWALLLSRYSGEDDIVFGATVSGRQMALVDVETMVGLFINTLPARVQISTDTTLIPWLQQLQSQQVEAEQYSYTPLVDIQSWSEVPHGTPLFNSILVFENYPIDASLRQLSRLTISNLQVFEQTNYSLSVICVPGQELSLKIIYDKARFEAATIDRMLGHLQTLLEGMVANPEQRVTELPMLTKAEQHQLLVEWNDTAAVYPKEKCIHQLFEAQVEQTPDAVAVVFEDQQLTYQALNVRANQLAHHLQTLGVGPEVLVGICVERSFEMVIGLLGILKAGGAYVPLDPSYPKERLALILEDANVSVLLTQERLIVELPKHQAQSICFDSDWETFSDAPSNNPATTVEPKNSAYVIYTSGSTGKPKGVVISHQSVVNFLSAMQYSPGLTEQDILLAVTTISFDIAVLELYLPLMVGAQIVLVSREIASDGIRLLDQLNHSGATVMQATPATWRMLLMAKGEGHWSKKIIVGGEALPRQLALQLQEKGADVWNLYGPTETTVWSACYPVAKAPLAGLTCDTQESIGRPIANTQLYILDSHLQLVPIGVPGELYIGGDGLARGYLNRPELSQEKFIPNPFSAKPGTHLYKTGDLARYLPDGNIEFLGRIDHQVKLRGFRIELGEIEALLSQHPNVRESAVIAREDQSDNKRIVAYLVSDLVPERIPYQSECIVEQPDGQTLTLHTEDISGHGVCLQLGETITLNKGNEIRLQLQLPNESEARWLPGKIVWSQASWARVELTLMPSEQALIDRSVEYLLEDTGLLKVVQRLLVGNLRHYLEKKLPNYMVPAQFVLLSALPLTPNGKINRRALPAPDEPSYSLKKEFMPQTEMENVIAAVWQEVLQIKKVGIHDHFFEIGGHSLLIAQVQSKLQGQLGIELPMMELFEYPTIHALAEHLTEKRSTPLLEPQPQTKKQRRTRQTSNDIAIIGMAGRFPGAKDIETFWQNLRDGVESIAFFEDSEMLSSGIDSSTLAQPNYVKAGGVLPDVELFDANFFDFSPKEAELMDPQHRLFLECAWQALENAAIAPGTDEYTIGVYAGAGINTYLLNNLYPQQKSSNSVENYQMMIGNGNDFLPTRVSYKLNLKGPSVNVQTACSTSLVAVHSASQSLLDEECDIALAGGVSIPAHHKTGYLHQEGMIYSPDGHCRAFDAKAQGTVGSNGVGVVVLKRLGDAIADGDNIHAIIKGSAINNDGSMKVGYTAPSIEGQAAVISEALNHAGIEPETISYIETHGTGTKLGDPIEVAALSKVFQSNSQKPGFCAIGSVKTNIGHADTASGVAGLIKTVLALKHQALPPSLHFEQPNPQIDFANSPFYVNTSLSEWKTSNDTPRRAGVSSFGIGGTNAHVILEEAKIPEPIEESRPWQLLVLSAKTDTALETVTANLATYLEQHPDTNLVDVAYTLSKGRKGFSHRRMLVCQHTQEAKRALSTVDPKYLLTGFQEQERSVVFMFSGQGAQYVNMGLELYQTEAFFREEIDRCSEYLKPHLELDLRQILYPSEAQTSEAEHQLKQTAMAQPALFVIEYALAKLWMSWGVQPDAMIGHSIGEYVAACLSGVFSLEEALALVAARGRLMQQLPSGAMLAVSLSEQEVQPLLSKGLSLAAINAPSLCVVSGVTETIEALETRLMGQGVECRRLQTSHAFHSQMMAPILASFTDLVKQVRLCAPQIPYLSNVTGTWVTVEDALNYDYWANHLRHTVRFADGLQQLLKKPERILLEVGPGRTLNTLVRRHSDKAPEQVVLSSLRHPKEEQQSDVGFLLNALGKVWLAGGHLDWSGFYAYA